ncbi:hypothetical protein ACH4PR_40850 [Streptomyces mirabilis]|uniref:hypothetical protein n=1 Tax=Streptomyces mirabilis TaxID=68239 RepID=UPI0037B45405
MLAGPASLGTRALVRLEQREQEIAARAEQTRERIAQRTAMLDELGRTAEEVRITRKMLLELSDPARPEPPASAPELPDGAAHQRIMAVFAQVDGPLRARACVRPWT